MSNCNERGSEMKKSQIYSLAWYLTEKDFEWLNTWVSVILSYIELLKLEIGSKFYDYSEFIVIRCNLAVISVILACFRFTSSVNSYLLKYFLHGAPCWKTKGMRVECRVPKYYFLRMCVSFFAFEQMRW